MGKPSRGGASQPPLSNSEPPRNFADVPPPQTPMLDHSFTLQAIIQNQQTLGEIKGMIHGIEATIKDQGKKIDRHGTIIATATGAMAVIIIITGFLFDKLWDKIAALVTITPPH